MLLFIHLMACAETTCQKGFSAREDGLCYEDAAEDTGGAEDSASDTAETADSADSADSSDSGGGEDSASVTVEDVLADLPACEPTTADGRLDIVSGCAGEICPEITAEEAVALLGEPDSVITFLSEYDGYAFSLVVYTWDSGIELVFDDEDQDGVPDPGVDAGYVDVLLPWEGGTTDGLGLWASVSCFVDALGAPDSIDFTNTDTGFALTYAHWSSSGISIRDELQNKDGPDGSYGEPDGLVDEIVLYGGDPW